MYPHPIIAREGWPFITIGLIAALTMHYFVGKWAAFPLWFISLFMLQFFRDPQRTPKSTDANDVLTPADGRIVVVMNVFNVHSQRSPVNGTVDFIRYYPGAFLNAALSKASLENERNAVLMHTDQGVPITVVQVAGLVARRILCYTQPEAHLSTGERYGFIRFGSRLDVYLPPSSQAAVAIGDTVYAGQDVLARLGPPGQA